MKITAVDLFCGAGGTSTGLTQAAGVCGARLDLTAVNHWDRAIETHAANHPEARHLCHDLDDVNPTKAIGRKLDLLIASPECFPAGTLILTANGYRNIESVAVGDYVLTHRNRWRQVTSIMTDVKDTVVVSGQGHYGLETTAEHPFYVRERGSSWPGSGPNRPRVWTWSDPAWHPASNLEGRFWACPSAIDSLTVPAVGGRGFDFSEEFWWLVGLWVAEGTVRLRDRSSEITISCGRNEANRVTEQLNRFAANLEGRATNGQLRWRRREVRTAVLFETGHDGFARWLVENFGRHSYGKRLPGWMYGMQPEDQRAFLAGYLQGDGHVERKSATPKQTCQTVSRELAFGIRTLAGSLGLRASMHLRTPTSEFIEGRHVNVRMAYGVAWTPNPMRQDSWNDGQHHWQRVNGVNPGRSGVLVYNLSVNEDESYVAEGVVVHNCTHHSNARGAKPKNDQSRSTAWHVIRWAEALRPRFILVENVREFQSWGPLSEKGKPLVKRKGETFQAWAQALRSLGYVVDWRVLNAADYGAATSRQRLFVMARRGRGPIPWPDPTHAREAVADLFGRRERWRAAREVIDWALPCPSIFGRKKPLRERTIRRIEAGLRKFGGANAEPFLVVMRHMRQSEGDARHCRDASDPLPTLTAGGTHLGLVQPHLIQLTHGGRSLDLESPLPTVTTAKRGEIGVVQPFVIPTNYGERQGQAPRTHDVDEPLPTIVGTTAHGVCQPFLVPYYGTGLADDTGEPVRTLTARDRLALVTPDGVRCDIGFRMLQPHEMAAAMGFPKGFRFSGSKKEVVKQIGNAVEVRQARALCEAILRAMQGVAA